MCPGHTCMHLAKQARSLGVVPSSSSPTTHQWRVTRSNQLMYGDPALRQHGRVLLRIPTSRGPPLLAARSRDVTSAGGWCTYCGSMGVRAEVVDHVVPLEQGGANDITNLVPACRSCNASKRDRTPEQWRNSLERRTYGPPRGWDEPPYPDILDYTDAGLTNLVREAQSEVLAAALPYQERAAAKMKARVHRLPHSFPEGGGPRCAACPDRSIRQLTVPAEVASAPQAHQIERGTAENHGKRDRPARRQSSHWPRSVPKSAVNVRCFPSRGCRRAAVCERQIHSCLAAGGSQAATPSAYRGGTRPEGGRQRGALLQAHTTLW
jgi:5-methylcytosine-specific restriction endonuclease McrA